MSAITGIFYRDGRKVDPELIKKMNDRLSHRGPDGSAIWCEGSVALGHQMLWTTPESLHEKLPFEESGLVITADARIDNRKELSEELGVEDKEDVSDSYFILKAYEKWGEKCPEYLLGDFAFAIWDKNDERLFCARDHMGVKPFYYYLDEEMFVFGTEIKALFCVSKVPNEINEIKVAHHLIPIITDRKLTFYKNVHRLPAAQILSLNKTNYKKEHYWELNTNLEIIYSSDEDYYNKFHEIFKEAVKCRLRTNYKIGFELSGGIDSSSVVGMAKYILSDKKTNIHTFSLVFNEINETDESYYIKKVVETGGIKPYYLVADSISPFKDIENILFYQDEPLDSPNIALIWQLYKKMHENGVKVVLGGHDGDCLLYKGEKYLMELFVSLKWKKLVHEINCMTNGKKVESFKLFFVKVIFILIPQFSRFWIKIKGIRREKDFVNINNDFEKRFHLKEHYKEMELRPFRNANTSKKVHYYYLTLATHQYIFEMMDKFAGAFTMEPRHPMMDKRLVEFCYAVPTYIKYDQGWGRLLARRGLAEFLPKEVQWRRGKCNFFHVFERNFILFEKEHLKKLTYNKLIESYVDCDELIKIYQRFMNGNSGADSIDLWKTAILSIWLNKK
jgi:asparagine synthase (glutamine-hydrolysing)